MAKTLHDIIDRLVEMKENYRVVVTATAEEQTELIAAARNCFAIWSDGETIQHVDIGELGCAIQRLREALKPFDEVIV